MTHPTRTPSPTPACVPFEPLLPLLDSDALTGVEVSATRQHIAACAWCRAQYEQYEAFEAALRRQYSPDAAPAQRPPFLLEDIIRADDADAWPDDAPDELEQDVLEISPLTPMPSALSQQRRSRRFRLPAEIAAALVVGLLVTTLLVSRFGFPGAGQNTQPPLTSSAGAVVFVHSVTWGRLQVNGRTIRVASDGHFPLYLPRGQNTLSYYAPPLPALTCTISAPAAHSDTCPLLTALDGIISSDGTPASAFAGRIVDLRALPERLSATQRAALVAATQGALDVLTFTTPIQPGDHYLTPEWHFATATQALPVTLSYQIAAENIGASLDTCAPYCTAPETSWSIAPTIQLNYTDQYGNPETVQLGTSATTALDVDVAWRGAWQVSLPQDAMTASLCNVIVDALQFDFTQQDTSMGFSCGSQSTTQAQGMLLPITVGNSNTQNEIAYVLYRGGAFLALDSNAHTLFPSLPGPSAHELAIARQLGFRG